MGWSLDRARGNAPLASWLGWKKVFLATGVGMSIGRYTGTETTARDEYMPVYMTKDVERIQTSVEAYLRFGVAFNL